MNQQFFDTITRLAAGASRHVPLASPESSTGLSSEAKKKTKKKNGRSSGSQARVNCENDLATCLAQEERCAAQEETCRTYVTAACGSDPNCPRIIACCTHFATCDVTGFLACLENGGT